MPLQKISRLADRQSQSISKFYLNAKVLNQNQQGREIYYRLETKKMKEIDAWLKEFRDIWETRFNQLDNIILTLKK